MRSFILYDYIHALNWFTVQQFNYILFVAPVLIGLGTEIPQSRLRAPEWELSVENGTRIDSGRTNSPSVILSVAKDQVGRRESSTLRMLSARGP